MAGILLPSQAWDQQALVADQRTRGTLSQLQGILGLQDAMRKQALSEEYRQAIAGASTPEARLAEASRFMGPNELGKMIQSSQDRQAQIDATKQTALLRLSQAAARDKALVEHRARTATTDEERLHWKQQMDVLEANERRQAGEIAAGRYTYDTGYVVQPFRGAIPSVPLRTAAASSAPTPVLSGLDGVLAGRPPAEQQAILSVAGPQPRTTDVPSPGGIAYNPALQIPQAGPSAESFTPPSLTPTPASTYGPEGRFPPVGQAALAPIAIPTASVTTAPKTAIPEMPPEIKALPPKAQQQWLLQQTKPSIAGGGNFTPQTLEFVAKQYLAGDRQAVQGFARSATARIALQNAIVDEATRRGMTPEQTAAKIAEFAGTIAGSRTVGQRAANISLAATEATEMLDIVKETSDQFARTRFVPWNMALRAYESGTGSPEISAFGASVNALVNVYARAINPTGVPTVSDKEHARAVLNTVQSPAQVNAVLGIIRRELDIAMRAPATVREATRGGITGETPRRRASDNPPARNAKGWPLMTDAQGNKAYVGPNKEVEEIR